MRSKKVSLVIAGLLVLALLVPVGGCKKEAGYPTEPIEYVCQASAGGSSDRFVRTIVQMMEELELFPVPITVTNQTGGGGAVAANYMKGKEGNPYYLLNTSGNFIAAPLRDPTVPGYQDFTPICRFAFDLNSLVVSADSPYQTIDDLVAAAKANPGKLSFAGTSIGSQDHLTLLLLQRAGDCEFKFVMFDGSNEVMAALLGGHVDAACAEPWVAKAQADAGEVRILGLVADERLEGLDVPTLKEQGYDVVIYMQRGVVAAGNIPEEAREYLIEKFTTFANSRQWKDHLAKEGLMEAFVAGDEYAQFLAEETDLWRDLLIEAGVIGG